MKIEEKKQLLDPDQKSVGDLFSQEAAYEISKIKEVSKKPEEMIEFIKQVITGRLKHMILKSLKQDLLKEKLKL